MESNKSLKRLAGVLRTLGLPIRLKIIAMLSEKSMYISEISKRLKLSYPLTHLHLAVLEKYGLIKSEYKIIDKNGPRLRRYYTVNDFSIPLSPKYIKKILEEDQSES